MLRKLCAGALVLTLAVPGLALACENEKEHAAGRHAVKSLTVAQLASLQKAKKATVLDASPEPFRKEHGVIPGAVLLSSFNTYDVARELPAGKDSRLVFYCSNTQCKRSYSAALRAVEAGYTDVSVLPEGLQGWKKAGHPTTAVAPRS
jgi:rhodanese-related sulfurtransferase